MQSSIQRIQNDTQKDAPNNRSVKGLSPQNSIRSRASSTFSTAPHQVSSTTQIKQFLFSLLVDEEEKINHHTIFFFILLVDERKLEDREMIQFSILVFAIVNSAEFSPIPKYPVY